MPLEWVSSIIQLLTKSIRISFSFLFVLDIIIGAAHLETVLEANQPRWTILRKKLKRWEGKDAILCNKKNIAKVFDGVEVRW